MYSLTNKLRGLIATRIQRFIATKFPRRVKRLIFISSILSLIKEVKNPDRQLIEKLNSVLHIARYSDAWVLPMHITSLIWNSLIDSNLIQVGDRFIALNELNSHCLNDEEQKCVGDWFAQRTPSWLRYGSDDLLKHDVVSLLYQLQKLETA